MQPTAVSAQPSSFVADAAFSRRAQPDTRFELLGRDAHGGVLSGDRVRARSAACLLGTQSIPEYANIPRHCQEIAHPRDVAQQRAL